MMQMPWEVAAERRKQTPVQGASPFVYSIPDPKQPGELTIQGQTIQRNAAQLGLTDEEARRAEAEARKAEADARIAEANAQGAGQEKTAELNQRDEYNKRRAKAEAATRQLQTVEGLFREDFQGGGILQSIREMLPDFTNDANSQFTSAAAGLQAMVKPIFKVAGEGTFTDKDAADMAEANRPGPRDRDAKIRQKLDNVRIAVDAEREALGLPAIDWDKEIVPDVPDATTPTVGTPGSDDGQKQLSKTTRMEEDPTLKAVALQLGKLVAAGVPDASILNFLKKADVDPTDTNVAAILEYRRTNPEYKEWKRQNPKTPFPVGESFWQREIELSPIEQIHNSTAQSAPGAGLINFAQGMTGNYLDEIAGAMGGNAERVKAGTELIRQEHPVASIAGDIAGQTAAEFIAGRVPGARALLASKMGRRGADAAYGAVAGSGASEDDRFSGAITGGAANAAGGMVGRGVQKTVGGAIRGVRDETLRRLNDRNIEMTAGEMARTADNVPGRALAWTEDRFAGMPGTDAWINSARYRGGESFNRAAMSEAADRPVTQVGEDGVTDVGAAVTQAYRDALGGVTLTRDKSFNHLIDGLKKGGSKIPRFGDDYKALADEIETLWDNGQLTGDRFQEAIGLIRKTRSEYAGQPGSSRFTKELNKLEKALTGLVARQAPDVMPALERANAMHGKKRIIQKALGQVPAQRNDGLISPQQLNQASIANTRKYGGEDRALSADRPFYELTKDAMDAMGPTIADSGTAGRAYILPLVSALGLGGAEALDATSAGDTSLGQAGGTVGNTLGLLSLAAMLPYSKVGQRAIQKGLLSPRSQPVDEFGRLVQEHPEIFGKLIKGGARDIYIGE